MLETVKRTERRVNINWVRTTARITHRWLLFIRAADVPMSQSTVVAKVCTHFMSHFKSERVFVCKPALCAVYGK